MMGKNIFIIWFISRSKALNAKPTLGIESRENVVSRLFKILKHMMLTKLIAEDCAYITLYV